MFDNSNRYTRIKDSILCMGKLRNASMNYLLLTVHTIYVISGPERVN